MSQKQSQAISASMWSWRRQFSTARHFSLALGVLVTALTTTSLSAQERPTGGWEIIANGFSFTAEFSDATQGTWTEGGTTGTIRIIGWNSAGKEFKWERIWPVSDPRKIKIQTYTGYLFSGSTNLCTSGVAGGTMAGSFDGSAATGAPLDRMTYGWVARQCLIR